MIGYITLLRGITMIFVLLIHISASMVTKPELSTVWWTGNIFDGISRWCVPVYMMISGALLLSKDEPIKVFFRKRAGRILIPFLFWATFYGIWKYRRYLSNLTLGTFVQDLISDGAYYHLWFLYALIGLYLVVPILRKITTNEDLSIPMYFVVIWFVAEAVSSLFSRFMGYSHGFRLDTFKGYTGYLLLGYVLFKLDIKPKMEKIFYILGMIGLFFTIYGTYLYKVEHGTFTGFWYSNLSFTTIFVASAIFVFFKQKFRNYQPGKIVQMMASFSFGIYLVHPFIRDIFISETLKNLIGFKLNYYTFGNPFIGVIITLICLYLASFFVVYMIKNIPYLRRIV